MNFELCHIETHICLSPQGESWTWSHDTSDHCGFYLPFVAIQSRVSVVSLQYHQQWLSATHHHHIHSQTLQVDLS